MLLQCWPVVHEVAPMYGGSHRMVLVAGRSEGSVDVQLDLASAYIGNGVQINRTLAFVIILLNPLMSQCGA